jgi:periplasmic protein TonB
MEQALQRNKQLTEGQYKLVVTVWVKQNGDIEKLDVVQSDANPEIEQTVKAALNSMPAIREAPPEGMPQPIKLRITARKMG